MQRLIVSLVKSSSRTTSIINIMSRVNEKKGWMINVTCVSMLFGITLPRISSIFFFKYYQSFFINLKYCSVLHIFEMQFLTGTMRKIFTNDGIKIPVEKESLRNLNEVLFSRWPSSKTSINSKCNV